MVTHVNMESEQAKVLGSNLTAIHYLKKFPRAWPMKKEKSGPHVCVWGGVCVCVCVENIIK